jgi:hypothetical protein
MLSRSAIPSGLQVHIDNLPILVHGSPKIMLLAVDLHKHFVNVEGIAVASMFSLQSPSVFGSKFDAPEPDGFIADSDTTFGKQIFNEWSGTPGSLSLQRSISIACVDTGLEFARWTF